MAIMATTKKPAAADAPVEEYDFDGWDQEKEDAALRELNDVKHIIVEQSFVGRFATGEIVKIPLTLSLAMIEEIQGEHVDPIEQFKHLIRVFVGEEFAASLDSRSLIPVSIMTEKYFRALRRAQELAFPES
jgi:hypothetical protein